MVNNTYSFEKNKLLQPISKLIGITAARINNMPVLNNVLVEFGPEDSKVTATNLETSAVIGLDVNTETPLKLLLPARRFTDMIKELDNENIEFKINGSVLDVRQKQTKFTVALQDIADYPEVPEAMKNEKQQVKVRTDVMKAALDRVEFAVSRDETRIVLTGVYLLFSGKKLLSVATDGFRMACYGQGTDSETDLPGFVIPRAAVAEIRNIILTGAGEDVITIEASNNNIVLSNAKATLTCRQIEGEYPDYKNVIPANQNIITVNRELILKAVRKVSSISDRNDPVKITISGETIEVLLESDIGKAKELVPVTYSGPQLNTSMNIKYLSDVLHKIPDEDVIIEAPEGYGAYLLKGLNATDYFNIIMPLRA